jgi:signal transduction histidine kinase
VLLTLALYTGAMSPAIRPEAIDTRLVFRLYAAITIPAGIIGYAWPALTAASTDSPAWLRSTHVVAGGVAALGCCAASLATIEDPVGRRRALMGFAYAHILFGALLLAQTAAVRFPQKPASLAATALSVGLVLLYLAVTAPGLRLSRALPALEHDDLSISARRRMFVVRNKPALASLRSQYEQQIRQAARQEERARLARDLHDAVKQQLFVIQTAAATAQTRFDTDVAGARTAVDQVRSAAREAMTEMEAMLEQLQAAPLTNSGLVASLEKQCEALGFRTGAHVTFDLGTLPNENTLDPGGRQAIFRVAQEALANVARHARARNVRVSLGRIDGQLALTVEDDGSGFKPEGRHHGMGMANIAARAAEVGGNFEVVGAPDHGTTVRFSVPVEHHGSARPYVRRAIGWALVLTATIGYWMMRGSAPGLLLAPALVVIASIAVARYGLAAYRLRGSIDS